MLLLPPFLMDVPGPSDFMLNILSMLWEIKHIKLTSALMKRSMRNDYPLNHSAPVLPSLQFSCYFNTVAAGCFSCPRVEATSIT